jgi:hypothetical protein
MGAIRAAEIRAPIRLGGKSRDLRAQQLHDAGARLRESGQVGAGRVRRARVRRAGVRQAGVLHAGVRQARVRQAGVRQARVGCPPRPQDWLGSADWAWLGDDRSGGLSGPAGGSAGLVGVSARDSGAAWRASRWLRRPGPGGSRSKTWMILGGGKTGVPGGMGPALRAFHVWVQERDSGAWGVARGVGVASGVAMDVGGGGGGVGVNVDSDGGLGVAVAVGGGVGVGGGGGGGVGVGVGCGVGLGAGAAPIGEAAGLAAPSTSAGPASSGMTARSPARSGSRRLEGCRGPKRSQ